MNPFTVLSNNLKAMNILEAKEELSAATKLYFLQDEKGNFRVKTRRARPLCLMGPAGIGKTEIVSQVAEEEGLALCSYSLVHHTRQSLLGLPRLENQEWDGETVSCTRYTMSEIIDQIHLTMKETGKNRGILFLDEFNCASESIRPVMLQLLQDKALGTHRIPEGWMLVLAGNPTQYNKSARDLDPVTMDRLRLLHLQPDLNVWLSYGKKSGIHPVVLAYLEENNDAFYRYQPTNHAGGQELVTPRGWEDLSIQLQLMEEIKAPVTTGFIGQFFQSSEVIHSFHMYYSRFSAMNMNGLLQRIMDRNPNCIGEIKGLNVQDRWAMVTSVVTRIKGLAGRIVDEESQIDRIHEILKENRDTLKQSSTSAITSLHEIADRLIFESDVQEKLFSCANSIQGEDGWKNITDYFQKELVIPITTARGEAVTQIENMLFICNEAISDAENAERLLHSIVEDVKTATFISNGDFPAFRTLCINTEFEGSEILKNLGKEAS